MYALPRAFNVGSLEAKVKERMHVSMTIGEHNEVALLEAAHSLREEMSEHSVTFPSYYQNYVSILSKNSPSTLPSPRYQV